jgi:5,5'-dehydrodivanillate O-demethylase
MLSVEQNERLTRVGPGTPGGELLRRYWYPIATAQDMKEKPTKAITILGEHLTLFKDKQGRLGLIAQRCPHRNVDLRYGFPENEGLRCPYHGWLFDTTGQCVETPGEWEHASTFAAKVKINSYPVEELGGLIFAYLGPAPVPQLPRWQLFVEPNAYRMIGSSIVKANWLQCQENSVDTVHLEWDHGAWGLYALEEKGITDERRWKEFRRAMRHHLKVDYKPYEHGIMKYRLQEGDDEKTSSNWNHGHPLIFPNMVSIGRRGEQEFQIRVPLDDETTWHIVYHIYTPGADVEVPVQDPVPVFEVPVVELPEWILQQDLIVWEAQDPITDRSVEMLGETDKGLIMYRKMLDEQIKVVEDGGEPMNVFREPHDILRVEIEDYGDMSDYKPGDAIYGNTGTVSGPVIYEVDALLTRARDAALARRAGK